MINISTNHAVSWPQPVSAAVAPVEVFDLEKGQHYRLGEAERQGWLGEGAVERVERELAAVVGASSARLLLDALSRECEAAGVRKLLAVIGDSANAGSIGVHRAAGFTPAGTLSSMGWKFGRWLDIVLMEKTLGDGNRSSPE